MAEVAGITDFLEQAGTQFRVFDMGRRIVEIERRQFIEFEQGQSPYPLPLQQQAWLGFVVWHEERKQDLIIWFLRFPLDAAGKLTQGIRDDFLLRLIEQKEQDSEEESNPYGYKPKQEYMACFHAKAARILNQPASSYYEHARDYLSGKPGFDQWAFVGFQGLADVCARLDIDDNAAHLPEAIRQMPDQPFEALAQCLEHEAIDQAVTAAIGERVQQLLEQSTPSPNLLSMCIRAMSSSTDHEQLKTILTDILKSPQASHPEVLASISGRCWLMLQQTEIIGLFLEALANCSEGQAFFNLVIVDLINIPGMQDSIHQAVRATDRSEKLSTAIGELFKSFT